MPPIINNSLAYDAGTDSVIGNLKKNDKDDPFKNLEHLMLPQAIQLVYKEDLKVKKLFDWQIECLNLPRVLE
jgi:hypothetical protein